MPSGTYTITVARGQSGSVGTWGVLDTSKTLQGYIGVDQLQH